MERYDGPELLVPPDGGARTPEEWEAARESARQLADRQLFAVLATAEQGHPYNCLVGFACSQDLRDLVFATPRETRKYRHLQEDGRVSLLVDDRTRDPREIERIGVLTILGQARVLASGEQSPWEGMLLEKHPYFARFVGADSTALVRVQIGRLIYVQRFQEVFEWDPRISG